MIRTFRLKPPQLAKLKKDTVLITECFDGVRRCLVHVHVHAAALSPPLLNSLVCAASIGFADGRCLDSLAWVRATDCGARPRQCGAANLLPRPQLFHRDGDRGHPPSTPSKCRARSSVTGDVHSALLPCSSRPRASVYRCVCGLWLGGWLAGWVRVRDASPCVVVARDSTQPRSTGCTGVRSLLCRHQHARGHFQEPAQGTAVRGSLCAAGSRTIPRRVHASHRTPHRDSGGACVTPKRRGVGGTFPRREAWLGQVVRGSQGATAAAGARLGAPTDDGGVAGSHKRRTTTASTPATSAAAATTSRVPTRGNVSG